MLLQSPIPSPHPLLIYASIILGSISVLISILVFITCWVMMLPDAMSFENWLCMGLLCVLAAALSVGGCLLTIRGLRACSRYERRSEF